jgi:uncharacterized Ntn-hydrolase superfamily protein
MCLIGQGYLNCGVPISPRPFNWSMVDGFDSPWTTPIMAVASPSIANHEYQSALINKLEPGHTLDGSIRATSLRSSRVFTFTHSEASSR